MSVISKYKYFKHVYGLQTAVVREKLGVIPFDGRSWGCLRERVVHTHPSINPRTLRAKQLYSARQLVVDPHVLL